MGGVQIDCPITKGYNEGGDHWGLDADARLRLWPAGYPWITPGTFRYPLNQRWFASHTLMANQIGDGERHRQEADLLSLGARLRRRRADGRRAGRHRRRGRLGGRRAARRPGKYPPLVKPRDDVIYLRDGRGWFYRYSHLDSIDPAVTLGAQVKMGQKIGVLGKKGASGGWSHLHFDIVAPQPSGRWGILEGLCLVWRGLSRRASAAKCSRPWPGRTNWPPWARRSRSTAAAPGAAAAPATSRATPGPSATARPPAAPTVERRYAKPGTYSEILKVTDKDGNIDYDFAEVRVRDPSSPTSSRRESTPPTGPPSASRPATRSPSRSARFTWRPDEGEEEWDFGDGTPAVRVRSDGNAQALAPDGYAITTHRYRDAGHYLVKVSRANRRGETATAHLNVVVAPR